MQLNLLLDEQRLIVAPSRVDSPLELQSFFFGDVVPIALKVWKKGANGIYAVDPAAYQISLLFGYPNTRPELGFWTLTSTLGTSKQIASRARASDVRCALAGAFGPVIVEGSQGSYIVTLINPGIWAIPTAAFQGNTLSSVLIFQITPGTVKTPAQYRIEVLEVAPARIIPAGWAAGSTNPVCTFNQISGQLWELQLDPYVDNGFFTLTVDGQTTRFVPWFAGAYDIARALAAIEKPANVQSNNSGGFWVQFFAAVGAASVGGNLVILPYAKSSLNLSSSGVREMLDGQQFAAAKLTIILVKDGDTITVSEDVVLCMPVNQPAVITIDAPQMAGLTFAISGDQAYLLVYKNAVLIGEIALNAGAANPDPNQPQLAFSPTTDNSALNVAPNGQWGYDATLSAP